MSVVVAIKDKEKDLIYMGCDSQVTMGTGKRTLKSVNNFKIWKVDDRFNCLMGGVGARRDLCFLRATPGLIPTTNALINQLSYNEVVTDIVPSMIQTLVSYGLYPKNPLCKPSFDDDGCGGSMGALNSQFLIAVGGNLYSVGVDGTVEEVEDYIAIGSGGDLASGSLLATEKTKMTPEERIVKAITAAARGDAYVSKPIIVSNTDSEWFTIYGEEIEKISSDHMEMASKGGKDGNGKDDDKGKGDRPANAKGSGTLLRKKQRKKLLPDLSNCSIIIYRKVNF